MTRVFVADTAIVSTISEFQPRLSHSRATVAVKILIIERRSRRTSVRDPAAPRVQNSDGHLAVDRSRLELGQIPPYGLVNHCRGELSPHSPVALSQPFDHFRENQSRHHHIVTAGIPASALNRGHEGVAIERLLSLSRFEDAPIRFGPQQIQQRLGLFERRLRHRVGDTQNTTS